MMEFWYVWVAFVLLMSWFMYYLTRRMRQIKKMQTAHMQELEDNKKAYKHLTSDVFDETPTDKLFTVVLYHMLALEDEMFDDDEVFESGEKIISRLTHGEKLMYTIYQIQLSMNGGKDSIHNFFVKDLYKDYIPYCVECFKVLNCFETADLMENAKKLADIIEKDLDDEELGDLGEYDTYNFSDFSNAIVTSINSSGIEDKAGIYIRSNKEEFVDNR